MVIVAVSRQLQRQVISGQPLNALSSEPAAVLAERARAVVGELDCLEDDRQAFDSLQLVLALAPFPRLPRLAFWRAAAVAMRMFDHRLPLLTTNHRTCRRVDGGVQDRHRHG
jgi:hypothetical protein